MNGQAANRTHSQHLLQAFPVCLQCGAGRAGRDQSGVGLGCGAWTGWDRLLYSFPDVRGLNCLISVKLFASRAQSTL